MDIDIRNDSNIIMQNTSLTRLNLLVELLNEKYFDLGRLYSKNEIF